MQQYSRMRGLADELLEVFHEIQKRGKLKLVYEVLARDKADIVKGAPDTSTVGSFRLKKTTG